MTKKQRKLLKELRKLKKDESDPEVNHTRADEMLLEYVNNDKITKAFNDLCIWYA